MLGDLAQRPVVATRPVPPRLTCGREPKGECPSEPGEALVRFVAIGLGEAGPVGLQCGEAGVPAIGLGLDAGEQSLDLGEVVDDVIGDTSYRLGRRVDPIGAGSQPRLVVPAEPAVDQEQRPGYRILDGGTGPLPGNKPK
jgi:hypothetical protein